MIHAVLIDDEKSNCNLLEALLKERCPEVKVVAMAHTVDEGYKAIHSYDPDLVFLDIEMPGQNGFDLLKKFDTITFETIFVTAYDEYAIQAIRFSALDYLLKPINETLLDEAVKKAIQKIERGGEDRNQISTLLTNVGQGKSSPSILALPDTTGLVFVNVSDIIRIDSREKSVVFILVDGKQIVSSQTLNHFEELLKDAFFRIHQSHIVNLMHVKKYHKGGSGELEMSDGSRVEIARRKKDLFLSKYTG